MPTSPPAPPPAPWFVHDRFRTFSHRASRTVGSPYTFGIAIVLIATWLGLGPWFGYSPEWALWIHTTTAIATFLVVFILQNTQNRDNRTIQLKLDELILQLQGPRNAFAALERMPEAELRMVEQEVLDLRAEMETADGLGDPATSPTATAAAGPRS